VSQPESVERSVLSPDASSVPAASELDRRRVPHDPAAMRVWEYVSHSPLHSMWDFQGASLWVVLKRTFNSLLEDNLLSRAAELGYYFLFALFPTLVTVSSIMGIAAKKATVVYAAMLNYLAIVIPHSAFQMVIDTFKQTTAASTGGKLTFGLAAALWSASVGFAAIQDTANTVYKVKETRPYWKSKGQAILVTLLLSIVITLALAALLIADYFVRLVRLHGGAHIVVLAEVIALRVLAWLVVIAFLMLLFAIIYYFAPDVKNKRWHWMTPGAALGIFGWLAASIGLRVYLYYFNSYTQTYGSLGAVIILLTWFYITGLMLLIGAEIISEIQAVVAEKRLKGGVPAADTASGAMLEKPSA
jgi:membrane protein